MIQNKLFYDSRELLIHCSATFSAQYDHNQLPNWWHHSCLALSVLSKFPAQAALTAHVVQGVQQFSFILSLDFALTRVASSTLPNTAARKPSARTGRAIGANATRSDDLAVAGGLTINGQTVCVVQQSTSAPNVGPGEDARLARCAQARDGTEQASPAAAPPATAPVAQGPAAAAVPSAPPSSESGASSPARGCFS